VDQVGTETRMFAEGLSQAFKRLKWHVSGGRMTAGEGVTIFNKWISLSIVNGPLLPTQAQLSSTFEIDPDLMEQRIRAQSKDVSRGEAALLARLALTLGAKIEKHPELDDNSISINIGDTTKGK
jgi:hypothetical protein